MLWSTNTGSRTDLSLLKFYNYFIFGDPNIDLYGGEVWTNSEYGNGPIFYFTLLLLKSRIEFLAAEDEAEIFKYAKCGIEIRAHIGAPQDPIVTPTTCLPFNFCFGQGA
jgi:hypothetical protein